MKKCTYCGRENADDATQCQECGTSEFAVPAQLQPEPGTTGATGLEQEPSTNVGSTAATPQVELDPVKLQEFQAQLRRQQNLPAGILAGTVAAIAGAIAWAAVTVTTHYQIGYLAIGIGFLVGFAVRQFGRGTTNAFAIAGCLLALLGCMFGNILSMCAFLSIEESIPLLTVLSRLDPVTAMRLLVATFDFMDLLFYGFALYAGYSYSLRRITPAELQSLVREKVSDKPEKRAIQTAPEA